MDNWLHQLKLGYINFISSSLHKLRTSKIYVATNPDISSIPEGRGVFTKTLPHSAEGGIVDKDYFDKLVKVIRGDRIYLDLFKVLVGLSSLYSLDLDRPSFTYKVKAEPSFRSSQTAGEMVELYSMAILRDVPFGLWSDHPKIKDAVDRLNKLSCFNGPKEDGLVTPETLFRGCLGGEYLSQFLLHSFKRGDSLIHQEYSYHYPEKDYLIDLPSLLDSQNGIMKPEPERKGVRYITTLRDGASYVQSLDMHLPVQNTLDILRLEEVPLKTGLSVLIESGWSEVEKLLLDAISQAIRCSLEYKWSYLRIRPEGFGLEIQRAVAEANALKIHLDVFQSECLPEIYLKNKNYLLPQVYINGSSPCPSYVSRYSTAIGAGVTILKALFETSTSMSEYMVNEKGLFLTGNKVKVEDELNKLVHNLSMFRCAAGVNFRSDNEGMFLGEEIAINLLKKKSLGNPRLKFNLVSFRGDELSL